MNLCFAVWLWKCHHVGSLLLDGTSFWTSKWPVIWDTAKPMCVVRRLGWTDCILFTYAEVSLQHELSKHKVLLAGPTLSCCLHLITKHTISHYSNRATIKIDAVLIYWRIYASLCLGNSTYEGHFPQQSCFLCCSYIKSWRNTSQWGRLLASESLCFVHDKHKLCNFILYAIVVYIQALLDIDNMKYSALTMSRGDFSPNNSQKTPMSQSYIDISYVSHYNSLPGK